ncbi:MAG: class I SAM-dependent methyltransferase [Candidatus Hodarchaeota archaeon]
MHANTKDLYDILAEDFNRSRGKNPWKDLVEFIQILKDERMIEVQEDSLVLDVGCGNGRNARTIIDNFSWKGYVGVDFSYKLIEIAKKYTGNDKRLEFIQASMTHLPFRDASFDLLACIAAFHHLSTKDEMKSTLDEFQIVLDQESGCLLFSTWRKWQEKFRNQVLRNYFRTPRDENTGKKMEKGIVNVSWKHSKSGVIYNRKYYLLSKSELSKLLEKNFKIKSWKKLGGSGKKDNHFVYMARK